MRVSTSSNGATGSCPLRISRKVTDDLGNIQQEKQPLALQDCRTAGLLALLPCGLWCSRPGRDRWSVISACEYDAIFGCRAHIVRHSRGVGCCTPSAGLERFCIALLGCQVLLQHWRRVRRTFQHVHHVLVSTRRSLPPRSERPGGARELGVASGAGKHRWLWHLGRCMGETPVLPMAKPQLNLGDNDVEPAHARRLTP